MKTAVIYARYSSDSQTEQSIEGQLRVCEEYAAKNNIVVIDTYIDRAMTGTNDNRPDFQRLLSEIEAGKVGTVIVKDCCAIMGLNQKDLENQGILA